MVGMNSTNNEVFTADPPVFLLKNLTVRVLEPHEYGKRSLRGICSDRSMSGILLAVL